MYKSSRYTIAIQLVVPDLHHYCKILLDTTMDIIMDMINIVIAIDINNYHYGLPNEQFITII